MPNVCKSHPVRFDRIHSHYRNTPPGLDARMLPEKFNCKRKTYIVVDPVWNKTQKENRPISFIPDCFCNVLSHRMLSLPWLHHHTRLWLKLQAQRAKINLYCPKLLKPGITEKTTNTVTMFCYNIARPDIWCRWVNHRINYKWVIIKCKS